MPRRFCCSMDCFYGEVLPGLGQKVASRVPLASSHPPDLPFPMVHICLKPWFRSPILSDYGCGVHELLRNRAPNKQERRRDQH